jgi:hypothetical protein
MGVKYKKNGAGDVYRKTGDKVECWFRGMWCHTIYKNTWNLPNLKPISAEEALKKTSTKEP